MKPVLYLLLIAALAGCSGSREKAINTICKGVNKSSKKCSSALCLIGSCVLENSLRHSRNDSVKIEPDFNLLDYQQNSLAW